MSGVLRLMHECHAQGEQFRKVVKDGRIYYKISNLYFPHDALSNLKSFDSSAENYSVGSLVVYFNNRNDQANYNQEALNLSLELIPRQLRRPLVQYIETGVLPDALQLDQTSCDAGVPAAVFEGSDDAEMVEPESEDLTVGQEENQLPNVSVSSVRDLTRDLTADKIALLASKAKQNRAQKVKLDKDDAFDKEVTSVSDYIKFRTRVHRDMTNCMDTTGDFSSVINLVNSLKSRDSNVLPKPPVAPNLQGNKSNVAGYSRYDQEIFQDAAADTFQIKTGMSFHGMDLTQINSLRTGKPVAEPSKIATSQKRPSSFGSSGIQRGNGKRTSRTPIIIVPATGTAMISTLNAMDILQEYKFVSTDEKKRNNSRRETEVLIQRRKDGNISVPYRIIDNPISLTPEEWDRVVAVFVQGPAWQFKGWHWHGNPTEIFSHVCAFHIKFEDVKLDPNVAKWSCEVLNLSKSKRHLDKAIFIRMWQRIEQFISRNKPNLRS